MPKKWPSRYSRELSTTILCGLFLIAQPGETSAIVPSGVELPGTQFASPPQTAVFHLGVQENGRQLLYQYSLRCADGKVLADLDIYRADAWNPNIPIPNEPPVLRTSIDSFDVIFGNILGDFELPLSSESLDHAELILNSVSSCIEQQGKTGAENKNLSEVSL